MNILFICKRYYTNKDVIRDQYGRLYELPIQLAKLGHQITVLCLDYKNCDPLENFVESFGNGSVHWMILSFQRIFTLNVLKVYRELKQQLFDEVIGSSDIPCIWLTKKLAHRLRIPYGVDLYDNYESFGQAKIPGFRRILKNCVRQSDLVIVVSTMLKDKVISDYHYTGAVHIMSNGIRPEVFLRGDKLSARKHLGLPLDVVLMGTAGGLSEMKGLDIVYEAWNILKNQNQNLYLVLAGKIDKNLPVPIDSHAIYLGELKEKEIGLLFQALDIGIISAHDSEFGKYCFPQKMYEMVASELPIVAAKLGAMDELLSIYPEMLFRCGDMESLVETLIFQLDNKLLSNLEVLYWLELVAKLEPSLESLQRLSD